MTMFLQGRMLEFELLTGGCGLLRVCMMVYLLATPVGASSDAGRQLTWDQSLSLVWGLGSWLNETLNWCRAAWPPCLLGF